MKTWNVTYDRFFLLLKTEKKRIRKIFGRIIEKSKNCSLGDEETTLIRDTFISNMSDFETRKELC